MMKTFFKKYWLLAVIIIVASVLRLWKLGSVPPALTPDEAALGYNAYSILHTGRDEFGKMLPLIFKSFGDYKPGLYVYLTIPSVALLGLTEFSTRLASALFGVLSVYMIYILTRRLFNEKIGVIAAFVAATNPYLLFFSRAAWEANVSLTLTLIGIYFFLKAMEKPKFIIYCFLLFGLTLLTYQGAKLSTSMVGLILLSLYWKEFWQISKKYLISGVILALLVSAPIILSLFNGQAERLTIFSIFSYKRPASETQQFSGPFYYIFHSEPLNYLRAISGRWFNVFSGKFLFFEGDTENPVSTAPYQGILLLADLLFLPLGLYAIFKNKFGKGSRFVLLWLILSPFSAAISRDTTNAVRSLNVAVPLVIIISLGLHHFLSKLPKTGYIFAAIVYVLSLAYFADAYFVHVPAHYSNFWRYGYKQAVNYIVPVEGKYTNIVFEQSFNQPYIYFLFYGPKDPAKYQSEEKLVNSQYVGDVGFEENLDNVQFKQIDWQIIKKQSGTLVVANPVSLPPDFTTDAKLLYQIKYLNGRDVAFDIVEIK